MQIQNKDNEVRTFRLEVKTPIRFAESHAAITEAYMDIKLYDGSLLLHSMDFDLL